jgi:hypothetical protein
MGEGSMIDAPASFGGTALFEHLQHTLLNGDAPDGLVARGAFLAWG